MLCLLLILRASCFAWKDLMAIFRPRTIQHLGQHLGRGLGRVFTPISSLRSLLPSASIGARVQSGTLLLNAALVMGGVVLGVLLSTQGQSQAEVTSSASGPITRQSGREIVASTIHRLEAEQIDLKRQISGLRSQVDASQSADAQSKTTLRDISSEVDHQQVAAGMTALHGPGVVAIFDDSTAHNVPPNEDPAKYILHDYDLRDVLNTLWISGAEAVSLNGERIVGNTSLYCVGTTIIVNSTRLSPPYEVHAIGDPEALSAALQGSSQMEKLNQRAAIYDLPIKIEQDKDVLVAPYNGSFVYKYAQVQK